MVAPWPLNPSPGHPAGRHPVDTAIADIGESVRDSMANAAARCRVEDDPIELVGAWPTHVQRVDRGTALHAGGTTWRSVAGGTD
jgi:hypothetical protein